MESILSKMSGTFYALFRIMTGLLFMQHGAQKLFGWLGGMGESGGSAPFLSMMFFAGFIEFFGGLLVAVGFQTRLAAFVSSGQMAVAYFMAHASRSLLPIDNGGELAVLYCFAFLAIAGMGGKAFSVDKLMGKMDPPAKT